MDDSKKPQYFQDITDGHTSRIDKLEQDSERHTSLIRSLSEAVTTVDTDIRQRAQDQRRFAYDETERIRDLEEHVDRLRKLYDEALHKIGMRIDKVSEEVAGNTVAVDTLARKVEAEDDAHYAAYDAEHGSELWRHYAGAPGDPCWNDPSQTCDPAVGTCARCLPAAPTSKSTPEKLEPGEVPMAGCFLRPRPGEEWWYSIDSERWEYNPLWDAAVHSPNCRYDDMTCLAPYCLCPSEGWGRIIARHREAPHPPSSIFQQILHTVSTVLR